MKTYMEWIRRHRKILVVILFLLMVTVIMLWPYPREGVVYTLDWNI